MWNVRSAIILVQQMDEMDVTHVRTLHKRVKVEDGVSLHESWSLVNIDEGRRVLYEAFDDQQPTHAHNFSKRLMTVQQALREPHPVARMIWLALED